MVLLGRRLGAEIGELTQVRTGTRESFEGVVGVGATVVRDDTATELVLAAVEDACEVAEDGTCAPELNEMLAEVVV